MHSRSSRASRPDDVLFGDVWERKGLSKRDRSLITVATLVALYRPEQLRGHLRRALANGVTNASGVLLRLADRHVGRRDRKGNF
jgi:alkylhydroperoxidase/carboxymuconolactone decarboxylase family protein YurZ